MSDDTTILFFKNRPVRCVHCGMANDPQTKTCSKCGQELPPAMPPVTRIIERAPLLMQVENLSKDVFHRDAGVLLQFLPSGTCMHSTVIVPLTLGREESGPASSEMFDLSSFNALRHGVSRHHCQLQRRDNHLVVVDLNSTNGTYLNGQRLKSFEEHVLSHGDELVLGTLHVTLFFQRNMS